MSEQVKKEGKKPKQENHKHEGHKDNSNVVNMPIRCKTEGCSKKSEKAEFCAEHFTWFKEGLITKEGKRPVDFERKMYHFQNRNKVA